MWRQDVERERRTGLTDSGIKMGALRRKNMGGGNVEKIPYLKVSSNSRCTS